MIKIIGKSIKKLQIKIKFRLQHYLNENIPPYDRENVHF